MDNSYIVKTIKQLCNEKQITIASLLEDCGLPKVSFMTWKSVKPLHRVKRFLASPTFFNCTVDYLLGRNDVSHPYQGAFSQEEIDLIMAYRQAEPNDRSIVELALHKGVKTQSDY